MSATWHAQIDTARVAVGIRTRIQEAEVELSDLPPDVDRDLDPLAQPIRERIAEEERRLDELLYGGVAATGNVVRSA
ncbi:hypothetical protein [Actinomycetospora sp. TBRC 11914]|uniref:hypothetical protein n=1 Tax=Actinomycetospora sp. TBRC 11914 TaxID=2729387 RepID=UPI00145E58AE|nr:hypothetical protein [Actinomycetospora sp. TBRC 11914]NMO91202.1 hypothetical protein [Actinomycetospora sp. TBRC 11914]